MKRQEAYFILIATFILVIIWISFSIIHSATDSTISAKINVQIANINPTFDTKIIDRLKTRQQITPLVAPQQIVTVASDSAKLPLITPTTTPPTVQQNNATGTAQLVP